MPGHKLTDSKIVKATKRDRDYKLSDGGGLFLLVKANGSKLWRWQYRYRGVPKLMALGSYPDLGLAEVREGHAAMRKLLRDGIDPMEVRKTEKASDSRNTNPPAVITTVRIVKDEKGKKIVRLTPVVNSFAWVEHQWYEQWKTGKSPRHAQQVQSRIETDILPRLGHLPIAEIEAPEIAAVALSIEERGAGDLARRSLHTMSQVFRYGIARGYARRNPATDIKASDFLKGVQTQNFARVTESELPQLLRGIERYTGFPTTRIAVKLMVRTFLRTSELILTPWSEFNFRDGKLVDKQWTIPAERMKMPSPHIVPLSRQVVALLEELHRHTGGTEMLFPNIKDPAKCMSKNTILAALETMGYKGQMTGHGFRGLASTILHEQGYDDAHIEIQLAHQERNSVKAAYNYAKYLEPRAKMMQEWSDYLDRQLLKGK